MKQFVNNGLTAETARLAKYFGIESQSPITGAASPFILHEAKADFLRLNAVAFISSSSVLSNLFQEHNLQLHYQ